MILIADGGSTKVDWRLLDNNGEIAQIHTKGANPFFRSKEDISEEIKDVLLPVIEEYSINNVYFFGAGCANTEKCNIIRDAILENIKTPHIEVNSDLLGAARGLCGHDKGIACILGTGSNSCYYNGKDIQENISPLGYILGDEGSGAVLGRLFIGTCLKNQLTSGIKEKFLEEFNLTPSAILDKVYRQPMPNRFLAGISPFILKYIEDETVYNLVYTAFRDFFVKNVMQYTDWVSLPVYFTGSVAYYYQDVLRKAASDLNMSLGNITRSPMQGLTNYYSEI